MDEPVLLDQMNDISVSLGLKGSQSVSVGKNAWSFYSFNRMDDIQTWLDQMDDILSPLDDIGLYSFLLDRRDHIHSRLEWIDYIHFR